MRKAVVCGTTVTLTVDDLAWLEEIVVTWEVDEIFVITGESVTAQVITWASGAMVTCTEHATDREAVGALGENGFVIVYIEGGAYSTVLTEVEIPNDAVVFIRDSPEEV